LQTGERCLKHFMKHSWATRY